MLIQVYLKRIYGIDRFYPANTLANLMCQLMGRKTFTKDELKSCQEIGIEIQIIPEALN